MGVFTKMWGSARGRVGGVVFSKGDNGLVYGRSYQPNVLNPKSPAQLNQRAKMNLVGQMSSVTPKEVLLGMGVGSNRIRRSEFTRHLLGVVTLVTSGGSTIAKVDPGDVVFSKGASPVKAVADATGRVLTASSILVATQLVDATYAGRYGERVVVALIDPANKAGYSSLVYGDIIYDNTSVKNLTLTFPKPIVTDTMVCVYRLPFTLTEDGSQAYKQMVNDGTDITAEFINSPSVVKEWGNSINDANLVFTQA